MPQGAAWSSICCSATYGIGVTNSNSGGTAERIWPASRACSVSAPNAATISAYPGRKWYCSRHERRGRGVQPGDQRAHPGRQVRGDLLGQGERCLAVVGVPEEQAQLGQRADRVQPVLELGDHAEVAAAAAQRPEQVRVLLGAGPQHLAGGGDDLGGQQVVA